MSGNDNTKALTVNDGRDEWVLLQKQCKAFIASGFLPEHIWKGVAPEQAMAKALTIAIKGRELGIPIMQSFSSITVIKGKPCLSAELMLALCYQRVAGFKATFMTAPEAAHQECTVLLQRQGGDPQTFRFTMDDAKAAGLVRAGSPWQHYPAAMLRARVISAACRAVAPDAIMGCYTPEEVGGEVVDVEPHIDVLPAPVAATAPPVAKSAESSGVAIPIPNKELYNAKPNWGIEPCTEKQIARLHAIGAEMRLNHVALKELIFDMFGKSDPALLTKAEIQDVFHELESIRVESPQGPAVGSDDDIANAANERVSSTRP